MRKSKTYIGIALALALVLAFVPAQKSEAAEAATEDWMSEIDGETSISEISIPGTHDSCSQHVALSYIFRCQDTSIAEQLTNGYRYLDIRAVLDGEGEDQTLVIKHNFVKCRKSSSWFSDAITISDVLTDVEDFLEEHPTETVIVNIKAENSDDDVETVEALVLEEVAQNPDAFYTDDEIPTLDEVRGKIVLANRFDTGTTGNGLDLNWEDQGDKDVVDIPYVQYNINDAGDTMWVQDRYNYDTEDKVDAVVDDLENCQADETTLSLNFTSTSGKLFAGHPKKYATAINAYLKEDYTFQQGTSYGIVIVDFADSALAQTIYATNF